MKVYINKLRNAVVSKRLTLAAKKRLIRDLEAVLKRIGSGEYETSGIIENVFDVPEKTKQFYALLDSYSNIGRAWSSVLEHLSINSHDLVLDLCPGHAPKVELGLFYCNYKGDVVVLDKDREALAWLKKFVDLFNPSFNFISYRQDFFSLGLKKFPLVIGNHVIDDLILCYFAEKEGVSMREIYEKEGEFLKMWDKILVNRNINFREVVDAMARSFEGLVSDKGYLCLTQYKSYMEKSLNLNKPYLFAKAVFNELAKILRVRGFVKLNYINVKIRRDEKCFKPSELVILKKL